MCPSHQGRFRQQVHFEQASVSAGVVFRHRCADRRTHHALLQQIEIGWNDRIFTPLVTLWVFLSQVLSADHSPRRGGSLDRASRAPRPDVALPTRAYCHETAVAGSSSRRCGLPGRSRFGCPGRFPLAVERSAGLSVEARRSPCRTRRKTKPTYPQVYNQQPGVAVSDRTGRGHHLALRGHREPRDLPVRRQSPRRGEPAAATVGRPSSETFS